MSNLDSGITSKSDQPASASEMQRIARHRQIYGSMADDVPMGTLPRPDAVVLGASMGTVGASADSYYEPVDSLQALRAPSREHNP